MTVPGTVTAVFNFGVVNCESCGEVARCDEGFAGIAQTAFQAKALDTKAKELIALAIGVELPYP